MLEGARILIVEDDLTVALDLANAVEFADGVVVGPFPSVKEALAILKQQAVSGAILDAHLTDRDVTPLAELLVAGGVPLIILTGTNVPTALKSSCPELPVRVKPTNPEILIGHLEILIGHFNQETLLDPLHRTP